MTGELFNSEPFAQIRGQMDFTYDGEPLWSPETVAEDDAAPEGDCPFCNGIVEHASTCPRAWWAR